MSNCVFCEILYGAEPYTSIYDGISTLGIVPLNPVTDGHVIFMPRKHVRQFDTDPNLSAQVMNDVALYAAAKQNSDGRDYNIIVNAGPDATQSVYHLHIHYVPRSESDGLALPWYSGKPSRKKTQEATP